jgi:hypothetical protein
MERKRKGSSPNPTSSAWIIPPEELIRLGLEEACPLSPDERKRLGDINHLLHSQNGQNSGQNNQGEKEK